MNYQLANSRLRQRLTESRIVFAVVISLLVTVSSIINLTQASVSYQPLSTFSEIELSTTDAENDIEFDAQLNSIIHDSLYSAFTIRIQYLPQLLNSPIFFCSRAPPLFSKTY